MITSPINTRLHGRALALARLVWVFLATVSFTVAAVALPALTGREYYTCPADPCFPPALTPADVSALGSIGLTLDAYIAYFTVVETIPTLLAFLAVGVLIFWRRSDDWMAILTSLFLVTFYTALVGASQFLDYPAWSWMAYLLSTVGPALLGIVFFVFPNGRFAPRWMKWFALALLVERPMWISIRLFAPDLFNNPLLNGGLYFILLATAFGSQVYRYLRVSTPVQRQQAKWIVTSAFMMPFSDLLIRGVVLPALLPGFGEPGLGRVIYHMITIPVFRAVPFILVPVSFGVAILRYRLWDIDLLIRRTLVYSLLTGSLALVYISSVVLLQRVVDTFLAGSAPIVTVVSTLAVAALFTPLRGWLQNFIDRRFYRKKYNAEKVLTAFSTALRDEVDLDRLTNSILGVVEESMQPEHLSFWEPAGRVPGKTRVHLTENDFIR